MPSRLGSTCAGLLLAWARALVPLRPNAIVEANGTASPSYEIFSQERLRAEHIKQLLASTALEAAPVQCRANCSYPDGGYCHPASGVCFCNRGWTGSDCSHEQPCSVQNCSGHGTCVRGNCQCDLGWRGEACQTDTCPHHCNAQADRGMCVLGTCKCSHGWSGASCGAKPLADCPVDADGLVCSGHGTCDAEGACTCFHTDYSAPPSPRTRAP